MKRGGHTGSGGRDDDGDGAGVWLFGMSGLQTCTPSENPCIDGGTHDRAAGLLAIQLCQPRSASKPNQAMAKEVMVVMCINNQNEANGRWFLGGSH